MNSRGALPFSGRGQVDAAAKLDVVDGGDRAPKASVVARKEKKWQRQG